MQEKICIHTREKWGKKKKKPITKGKQKKKLSALSPLSTSSSKFLSSPLPLYCEFGLFFLPMPTTTLTKRRLYLMRFMARPCCLFFYVREKNDKRKR